MSYSRLTNQQVLGRLSASWDDVSQPKHWAHEKSKTSSVLRALGDVNKMAGFGSGTYLSGKLVTNRRGRLAASGGLAIGTAAALGTHAWTTIQQSFTNVLGNVPGFLKKTAMYDMKLGVEYALGRLEPPPITPAYDNLRTKYSALYKEADTRGILPADHKYPFQSPFGETNVAQQTLATLATAAAVTLLQAGKAEPHRSLQGKGLIAKAIGVTLNEVENMYLEWTEHGVFEHGPHHNNEEFAAAPNAYDAPAAIHNGHVDMVRARALDRAEAAARDYAIQMAGHYQDQMNNGVLPGNVQQS
jgi:hypothetical protein